MSILKARRLLLLVLSISIVSVSVVSKPRTSRLTGNWGGPHIRLNVDNGSATVNYDCANGTITGPLTIDSRGRFSWRGFHNREHPGPIRADIQTAGQPATYTGSIKGDTMALTVRLADSKQIVDTFTLTRGGGGRIFKCK